MILGPKFVEDSFGITSDSFPIEFPELWKQNPKVDSNLFLRFIFQKPNVCRIFTAVWDYREDHFEMVVTLSNGEGCIKSLSYSSDKKDLKLPKLLNDAYDHLEKEMQENYND